MLELWDEIHSSVKYTIVVVFTVLVAAFVFALVRHHRRLAWIVAGLALLAVLLVFVLLAAAGSAGGLIKS
jgi:inner membrane protein involved in colicin E2 resistance